MAQESQNHRGSGNGLWNLLFQVRWMLARPLQIRLAPNFVPDLPIPFVNQFLYVHLGHLVLLIPLIFLFVLGYRHGFSQPELTAGGNIAWKGIVATFLTANKSNSIFNFLFGLSFERMVYYHRLCAIVTLIVVMFHVRVAYKFGTATAGADESESESEGDRYLSEAAGEAGLNDPDLDSIYGQYGPEPHFFKFLFDNKINWSGTATLICLIVLVSHATFRIIRRYFFEMWLCTHVTAALGVLVFAFIHFPRPDIVIVFLWWMLDLLLRFVIQAGCRYNTVCKLQKVSKDVSEIRMAKPANFCFQAGQFLQVCIPRVGMEFHPVTISSSPYENELTIHFRALGNWTQALLELAETMSEGEEVKILMEGPYGNMSVEIENTQRYPIAIFFSGGIGVTPNRSLAKQLLHEHATSVRELRKIHFIWAVRNMDLVKALPVSAKTSKEAGQEDGQEDGGLLETEIYVTSAREKLTEADELGDTNTTIKPGRPNVPEIIVNVIQEAHRAGVKRVPVMVCGPEALVDEVKSCCRKSSAEALCGQGVVLEVHEELFTF